MYILDVLVEYYNLSLDKTFTYYSTKPINLYSRVKVNFNNREIIGFVVKIQQEDLPELDYKIKMITSIIDDKPIINEELYQLALYLQDKYLVSTMQALQTILPIGLKPQSNSLLQPVYDIYLQALEHQLKLTSKQQNAYDYLLSNGPTKQSLFNKMYSASITNTLIKKEALKRVNQKRYYELIKTNPKPLYDLSLQQEEVYQKIINDKQQSFLIHGVTGSGKTLIYLHLAQYYLNLNKSILILVPEISLTTMIQIEFAARFKGQIALLHSQLNDQEKYQEYLKILNEEVKIIIGTRSSIFAPINNLGLIIIDEEHDPSYKQNNGVMYHTIDVALFRSKYHHCKLVLGSATPSLLRMSQAYKQLITYIPLNTRYNEVKMPMIELVDLSKQSLNQIVSHEVIKQIKEYVINDKQVIVLLNRRGYNNFLSCRACLKLQMCPHCHVALTYHKKRNKLVCHQCHYHELNQGTCRYCHSNDLKYLGNGTQKIEEYLENIFNEYQILRIDYDSTRNKNSIAQKILAFQNNEYQILIGTQMIAKGLNFEKADLVVVLNIDNTLAINSYKAIEQAYSLLVQVSGRSGRYTGEGKVLIETMQPDHYIFEKVINHDYLGYYQKEMYLRRKFDNPPYYYIAVVLVSGYDEIKVMNEAKSIYEYLNKTIDKTCLVLPNTPA
ncbi:MAG: replication restart helicase PriA, partial [Bacilli bacterium]